jgi:hypothetical protein
MQAGSRQRDVGREQTECVGREQAEGGEGREQEVGCKKGAGRGV